MEECDHNILDSTIWINRFGIPIPVDDMGTSYIRNCIKAFESGIIRETYCGGKEKWMKIFNKELANRRNKKIKIVLE